MSDEPFVIDDDDRYSRFRLIAWWDQEKLRSAKIMVVGAGALGNEVLKNLALIGAGNIVVIDFDEIEDTNLTRSVLYRQRDRGRKKAEAAADAVVDMNPDVKCIPYHGNVLTDIGLGAFRDVDVVIGCLDNREARLWVNRSCWKVGTPWIDGGIQEINGVAKVFIPPHGSCYECAMTENDYKLINLRYSCPLLKQEDLQAGKVPTAPTIASLIGGIQTQEALKLIHGMPTLSGEALVFNGAANQFYKTAYQLREDCLSHWTYPDPIDLDLSANSATVEQLFAVASEYTDADAGDLTLYLDRDLVTALECGNCDEQESIRKALPLVTMKQAVCATCGETRRPITTHEIQLDQTDASETLATLGIPTYDIVRVGTNSDDALAFLLAGDRDAFWKNEA